MCSVLSKNRLNVAYVFMGVQLHHYRAEHDLLRIPPTTHTSVFVPVPAASSLIMVIVLNTMPYLYKTITQQVFEALTTSCTLKSFSDKTCKGNIALNLLENQAVVPNHIAEYGNYKIETISITRKTDLF